MSIKDLEQELGVKIEIPKVWEHDHVFEGDGKLDVYMSTKGTAIDEGDMPDYTIGFKKCVICGKQFSQKEYPWQEEMSWLIRKKQK